MIGHLLSLVQVAIHLIPEPGSPQKVVDVPEVPVVLVPVLVALSASRIDKEILPMVSPDISEIVPLGRNNELHFELSQPRILLIWPNLSCNDREQFIPLLGLSGTISPDLRMWRRCEQRPG